MRAAVLHGPGDLRVEDVPEPDGEVVVEVRAATTCGTDVKMWRRGHPALGPYPSLFGHETAGVRADTGEPVLVSPSVACGVCAPCRAGRPQICRDRRWVLGGFAERLAAPAGALHPIPDGLDFAAAAMAEPLAAAVHALARAGVAAPPDGAAPGASAAVLGGGTVGLMLARLLLLAGHDVLVADRHPERRAQAEALGAAAAEALHRHDLVFEAVGAPETWRAAVQAAAPGGAVVLVGGCAPGTEASLPTGPLHYDEVDLRGSFHHAPAEVDRALALLASGELPWRAFAGPQIGLEDLPAALGAPRGGPARKWVVAPAPR